MNTARSRQFTRSYLYAANECKIARDHVYMNLRALRPRRLGWLYAAAIWWLFTLRFFHSFELDLGFGGGTTWGVADDVYITADFARTLVEGDGIRWYPGAPKVEGFTSPLWVAALAILHLMPGFSADRLGLYVLALNLTLLALAALTLWRCLQALAEPRERDGAAWWIATAVVAFGTPALCVWTTEGFEVALVTLLALSTLRFALVASDRIPLKWLGFLIGLAFWTRMDGVLYCAGAGVLLAISAHDPRRLVIPGVIAVGMVLALGLARYTYYGDLLPNTYYLKISGWPLERRWRAGLYQNAHTLQIAVLALAPLCAPRFWRLGRTAVAIAAAILTYLFSLAYSTLNGGDSWFQTFGYDRFGAIGSAFLLLAIAALLVSRTWRAWQLSLLTLWALVLISGPILRAPNWEPVVLTNFFRFDRTALPKQGLVQIWSRYGKLMREFTTPGANIAVCPAGAIIYFSRRGGIDILGKVDPYVAHLPAMQEAPPQKRCWCPERPGHNKEDIVGQFKLRRPELSEQKPPPSMWSEYLGFRYGGMYFYARRDADHILWQKVTATEPVTAAERGGF